MNPIEEARSRQIDAVLVEALRRDVPVDLEARLLARVATPRGQATRPSRWLIAAALLLGSVIVFAVADASSADSSAVGARAEVQDPKPLRITDASVQALASGVKELPRPQDARLRLMAIAKLYRVNVAIAASVKGHSKSDLAGMGLQAAIRTIAREVGAGVAEFGSVIAIGVGLVSPKKERVSIQAEAISVRALLKRLHAYTGVNFVVGDDVKGSFAIDVKEVRWRDLLSVVAKRLDFRVAGHGSVYAITKRSRRVHHELRFNFENTSMATIVTMYSRITGLNTVIDAGIAGNMTLIVYGAGSLEAVRASAACVGAQVIVDQIVRIEPKKAGGTASLTAESCDLQAQLGKWITSIPGAKLDCDVEGTFAAFVDRADPRELLDATVLATGRTVTVGDGTFTIR